MSYQFDITPREISVSPEALQQLCDDSGNGDRGIESFLQDLRDNHGLQGAPTGWDSELNRPSLSFTLQHFRSPEREGLEGIVSRLKEGLFYAEAQSFTITDEYGRTTTYNHPGFSSEEAN